MLFVGMSVKNKSTTYITRTNDSTNLWDKANSEIKY